MGRRRRTSLAVLDQLVFSFSNFLLTILMARATGPGDFGLLSLCLAAYLLFTVFVRGFVTDPLMVRFSAAGREQWREASSRAVSLSVVFGLIASSCVVPASILFGGDSKPVLMALAAGLPALACQDALRFAGFSGGRPGISLTSDLAFLMVQTVGILVLIELSFAEPWALLAVWSLGACIGALLAIKFLGLTWSLQGFAYLKGVRVLGWRYGLDNLMGQAPGQLVAFVLGATSGLADVGTYRGGLVLFQPASVMNQGVGTAILPELVRHRKSSPGLFIRSVWRLSGGLVLMGLAWSCIVVLLPDEVGFELLGETWSGVAAVVLLLAVGQVANGFRVAPEIGLRALGAAPRTLRARLVSSVVMVLALTAGALWSGVFGVCLAIAIARPVESGIWWYQFRRARDEWGTGLSQSSSLV